MHIVLFIFSIVGVLAMGILAWHADKKRKENSMTDKEAINYLKQLYPNGGYSWLDEQRIEAIGMAIKALQKEPVSEELEEACDSYYDETWDEHGGRAMVVDGCHDIWFPSHATDDFFKAGAQWQKQQIKRLWI